jgi:hypothetical protein
MANIHMRLRETASSGWHVVLGAVASASASRRFWSDWNGGVPTAHCDSFAHAVGAVVAGCGAAGGVGGARRTRGQHSRLEGVSLRRCRALHGNWLRVHAIHVRAAAGGAAQGGVAWDGPGWRQRDFEWLECPRLAVTHGPRLICDGTHPGVARVPTAGHRQIRHRSSAAAIHGGSNCWWSFAKRVPEHCCVQGVQAGHGPIWQRAWGGEHHRRIACCGRGSTRWGSSAERGSEHPGRGQGVCGREGGHKRVGLRRSEGFWLLPGCLEMVGPIVLASGRWACDSCRPFGGVLLVTLAQSLSDLLLLFVGCSKREHVGTLPIARWLLHRCFILFLAFTAATASSLKKWWRRYT